MIGVILAAGKGSRMYPFGERMPKPLLPILNRPLIDHQLEAMAGAGIRRVIIVVGYYGFEIVRAVGDGGRWGVSITYVDQEETLGIAHALGCLESKIDRPFLLFLGDIFFHAKDLAPLINPIIEGKAHAALAAKQETDIMAVRRNFAIFKGPDGAVNRVMEKPRYAGTNLKGCGLYAFDMQIFDAVRRTPRTAARNEYEITDSIQLLIQDGLRVLAMDLIEYDINLTYPEDLLMANQAELKRRGIESWIGDNFTGPGKERIEGSVIGDNVTLDESVSVRDSIIFSEVKHNEDRDLERMIITPSQVFALERAGQRPQEAKP
jgi:dTDP-glucose pyrophosphorylase